MQYFTVEISSGYIERESCSAQSSCKTFVKKIFCAPGKIKPAHLIFEEGFFSNHSYWEFHFLFFLWIIFGNLRSRIVLLTSKLWVDIWRINLLALWKSGFVFNAWLKWWCWWKCSTLLFYTAPAAEDTVMELFYTMGWKYGLLERHLKVVLWPWGMQVNVADVIWFPHLVLTSYFRYFSVIISIYCLALQRICASAF